MGGLGLQTFNLTSDSLHKSPSVQGFNMLSPYPWNSGQPLFLLPNSHLGVL